jgi:hypothetical protein
MPVRSTCTRIEHEAAHAVGMWYRARFVLVKCAKGKNGVTLADDEQSGARKRRPGLQPVRWRALGVTIVTLVFIAYGGRWAACHWGLLFEPALQNDDARTALFPFHQYAENPFFAQDPIAREMMAYVSPGIWFLYRLLVPLTGLYVASKWVQAFAFGIVLVAGVVLARSRKGGLASGLLLVFLILSDSYAVGRIAGGHARAFAFPCFALWVAGLVTSRQKMRFAAPILGALFYPAVTLMILAGEGVYAVLGLLRLPWLQARHRLLTVAAVASVSVLCSLPSAIGGDRTRGPIHTLAQAKVDPAFYREGRLAVLSFGEPLDELGSAFLARFSPSGKRLLPVIPATTAAAMVTALVVVAGVWALQRRRARLFPDYFWAFLLGACALYFAARWLAFRLYSTERYYAYALRMASTLMLVSLCAKFRPKWRWSRSTAQCLFAGAFMLASWVFLGDGIVGNNGMTIDARWDADLNQFVRTLPKTCRFASHPMDGDGIPYFAARATIGSFETLQPWFVDSWRRQVVREKATLDALYAPRYQALIDYGKRFNVDYLLVNGDRYQSDWPEHMASFEPFTTYTRQRAREPTPPALMHVPVAAVVFERKPWKIVELKRLRAVP